MELPEHSRATLAVRPEAVRISLAPPDPSPSNLLVGEVVEAIFEGGSRRWGVELAGGLRVIARESNAAEASHADGIARGARVYLTWDPARSLVFPRLSSGESQGLGENLEGRNSARRI
jgi:ABC-type Fe3+/spermidine/putrescine transport system ATPase subunit